MQARKSDGHEVLRLGIEFDTDSGTTPVLTFMHSLTQANVAGFLGSFER